MDEAGHDPRTALSVCLHEIFEAQPDRNPMGPAIECGDRIWSYAAVESEANRMARYLRSLGVGRGRFVGISLDRSEWPIVTLLAVLKAGGAYVPIEPSLPNDRVRYIADLANLAIVVTQSEHESRMRAICRSHVVTIEQYRASASEYGERRLSRSDTGVRPDDICYVLFTSGSTGYPKGVVTEHRNVVHFVGAFNEVCTTTTADRVFQGFSLGFDGSVEEMWMAFSNGATLVCGDTKTPRFGADLAIHLSERKITFLSTVPTLLSTLSQDIPSLRQLVVSGEACHVELVSRWCRPGLTMLNVYGPTEATVNTTACVLAKGKPVTIGRPLRGYDTHILDEQGRPVPAGEKGELYIGGAGISRGYLKQPELTDRAFTQLTRLLPTGSRDGPSAAQVRLYKTGDLVRWNDDGELEFFGRIDSQIKLRGYRIELSEIEAVLVAQPNITTAAARLVEVNGVQCLAAYVIIADPTVSLARSHVLAALRDRLPAYMVPTYLDVLDKLPLLVSGKVDRARLPMPEHPLVADVATEPVEMSPLETSIATVWSKQLGVPSVGPDQNFFSDLGGHSLLAAQLVSRMRTELDHHVSIRDIYACPTVRQLAARICQSAPRRTPIAPSGHPAGRAEGAEDGPSKRPWHSSLLQVIYLLSVVPLLALPMTYVLPLSMDVLQKRASIIDLAAVGLAVILGTWLALIIVAIAAKWILIGRYRPGRYRLWGSYFIRWWIASRLQHLSAISALNGTPLAPVIWRAMGAKVGRRCMINASLVYAWDCIRIGDDVSVGIDTQLTGLRVEAGHLVIGKVDIADRCFVGCHSLLGLNVEIGHDSRLGDQTLLPDGCVVPSGAAYRGSPAQPGQVPVPEGPPVEFGRMRLAAFGLLQLAAGFSIALITLSPIGVAAWLLANLVIYYPVVVSVPAFLAAVPATVFVFAVWSALCKRIVYPRPRPGTFEIYSFAYLQHWLSNLVINIAQVVGLSIFTTVYLPPWMRLLGARLGRHTEMSAVWRINPDMLTTGDGVFFADGSMIGGATIHLGRVQVARTEIGDRSFVGNSAILSTGTSMGSNCLLGVLSSLPHSTTAVPDHTDLLGSPGFLLPNRQKVSGFAAELTYEPTLSLYLQRAAIDGLRVLLPAYVVGGLGAVSLLTILSVYEQYGVWGAYTAIPILTWIGIMACLTTVIGMKWMIMGRFKPVVVPLWSRYVWWNELINGLYECLMAPLVSNFFGTPFAPILLRSLGCKIGRHCYVESTLFSEFDLVEIGDHVALNAGAIIQNHLFEDRVMKSSRIKIESGCTVGNMSVVLYDTEMERGAVLGSLSLLMKGEIVPSGLSWHGIPTLQAPSTGPGL